METRNITLTNKGLKELFDVQLQENDFAILGFYKNSSPIFFLTTNNLSSKDTELKINDDGIDLTLDKQSCQLLDSSVNYKLFKLNKNTLETSLIYLGDIINEDLQD